MATRSTDRSTGVTKEKLDDAVSLLKKAHTNMQKGNFDKAIENFKGMLAMNKDYVARTFRPGARI